MCSMSQQLDRILIFFMYILKSCATVQAWNCPGTVTESFANVGENVAVSFDITSIKPTGTSFQVFQIKHYTGTLVGSLTFVGGTTQTDNAVYNNGIVNVTLNNVQKENGGTYTIEKAGGQVEFCHCIYIYGPPRKSMVSFDNNNVLGRKSNLVCNSLSTTYPSNHTLRFTYSWRINEVSNPANTRYYYSSSRKTFTITNVSREDAGKRFKCSATESGDGVTGYTSDYSDEFIYTVIYGPDSRTTKLSPPNTEYTINEGLTLNDITCVSDCYPSCIFKWIKPGTNGDMIVSNNAVLSLGIVSRTDAATYTCTVINSNTTLSTERNAVAVHVICPDASTTKLTPSSTTYTRNEGYSLDDIHCSGNCYPSCYHKWTKSGSNTSVNSATLLLGSLDRTEAGTYTCTVSNSTTAEKQTKTLYIFVRYGPDECKFNLSSPLTLAERETSPTISCSSECYPPCSHTWINVSAETVIGENGRFQLVKATRHHAGNYECTCRNKATEYTKSITSTLQIVVQYDWKKEKTTVNCEVETDKTGLIVGICFGILSTVLTIYSTFITIALKRKTSNTGI